MLVPNLTLYGERNDLGPIGVMIRNNFREYRVMYLCYDIKDYLRNGENVTGCHAWEMGFIIHRATGVRDTDLQGF